MALPIDQDPRQSSMELLAPAGTFAAFEAALEEGADAVYVGAPGFNARALKRDFSLKDIAALTNYAHQAGRRIYVAMNSLVKEQELGRAVECLSVLEQIGPDALIVQDLGLFYLARKYFPRLSLHASTLLTAHNSVGAAFLTGLGFERVVLARELSLDEMEVIREQSKAELEIFIHGAMCFSYSGLCLFSSMHGGKSSLRGECVQPCRRNYRLQSSQGKGAKKSDPGLFLFSMNDLCGISFLSQLARMGIASLKIEGRLKSVEYVRKTVQAYRLCLDHLHSPQDQQKRVQQEAENLLNQAMGRTRTSGFFTPNREDIIRPHLLGVAGVFVGKGRMLKADSTGGRSQNRVSVQLRCAVAVGDRLRFQDEGNDLRESFTLQHLRSKKGVVQQAGKGQSVTIGLPFSLKRGQKSSGGLLFKVDSSASRKKEKGTGITVNSNRDATFLPEKRVVSRVLRNLGWNSNKSRATKNEGQGKTKSSGQRSGSNYQWWIRLAGLPPRKVRYPVRPEKIVVPVSRQSVDQAAAMGPKAAKIFSHLVWALPPVIHEKNVQWFEQAVAQLVRLGFNTFQLSHISQKQLFDNQGRVTLYGDYTCNCLNSAGLALFDQHGFHGVQFSLETDRETLHRALMAWQSRREQGTGVEKMAVGMYVYGKMPLFTAKLDAAHLQTRKQIISPKGEQYQIRRHDDLTFVRSNHPFVLLDHLHEMGSMGVGYFIMDLSGGPLHKEVKEAGEWMQGVNRSRRALFGNYKAGLV